MLKGLTKIIRLYVATDHGDVLKCPIRHDIGQKPGRLGQSPFRWLKPNHPGRQAEKIGVVRKRFHDLSGLFLTAVSTERR